MPTLQLKINNKFFNIACDDGQEEQLQKAADALNASLRATYEQVPSINADLALIITALTIQNQLHEQSQPNNEPTTSRAPLINQQYKANLINDLETITKSIEKLAISL